MAKSYNSDAEDTGKVDDSGGVASPSPWIIRTTGRIQQVNPSLPPSVPQQWRDTVTGQTYNGQVAANNPNQLITGFGGGNISNTTSVDLTTGKQLQADPHPWRDALKNTAMIWAGPELAGAGAAIAAGGAAGGGAGAAGGGAAAAGGTSAAVAPTIAGGAAAGGAGAAGAAGAGGVAGALGTYGPLLGIGANVAGGIEQGRIAGKQMDAAQAQAQNAESIKLAEDQALAAAAKVNQQISQKTLQASDYQRNYRNAIMAGLLSGVQDVNITPPADVAGHMGTITGGLRPSAISNRQQISDTVGPQALEALTHNPTTNDLFAPAGSVSPSLTPYPSSSGLDTALGGTALGLSALNAFSQLWPKPVSTVAGGNVTPTNYMGGSTFAPQVGTNPTYTVPGAFYNPRAFSGVTFNPQGNG